MKKYNNKLKNQILSYHTDYYTAMGLQNAESRALIRMNEDEQEFIRLQKIEKLLSIRLCDYKKHLIVGVGTGGTAIALHKLGVLSIFGIDTNKIVVDIVKDKAKSNNFTPNKFNVACSEALPYESNKFDFIHCFSVLEHVQDVKKSIVEMYRVIKPNGILYIHTPNYVFPFENHYKIPAPLFLGKTVTKLFFKIIGKPTKFLDSLQLVTPNNINKILMTEVDVFYFIYRKDMIYRNVSTGNKLIHRFIRLIDNFFIKILNVHPYQEIIIKKYDYKSRIEN